jgi:DNA-directed RNA polymerase subunit RPC12/RpoP
MPAQTAQKVCCMCGKDLAGKKRFKDSRGYWCPECSEEDARSKEDKGTPCEHCGRKVPEQSMTSVDGKMLCVRCVREQRELRAPGNKKFRAVNDRAFKEHEKKKMLIMGGILVVLLVLMIYAFMHFPALH